MKKLILFSALAVSGFISMAQTSFGIQGGANFATLKYKEEGNDDNSKTKVGFIVGAIADVPFGNSISFRPELNYIQKGGLEEDNTTNAGINVDSKDKTALGYIQLAPNFVYNFKAGSTKFFVGLGPDFSIGISGRDKVKTKISGAGAGIDGSTSETVDVKFDGKEDATDDKEHLESFDFGGNILAGFKIGGGFMSVGYTLGFSNIAPGGDKDNSLKNRGFNVKLGYMFGGHSMKKK